ncbi:MAG: hypothetical protein ACI9UK_002143 [Candidatus Krumholzibacteriia bacterium]|jgi:hypothetical protein
MTLISRMVVLVLLMAAIVGCSEQESETEAAARQLETARKLNSLPYVTTPKVREENKGLRGVITHEKNQTYQGLNLYGSLGKQAAHLRDMDGNLIHTWTSEGVFDGRDKFPLGSKILDQVDVVAPGLQVAEMHGEHLLAIETFSGLVKLDHESQVVFAIPNHAHHDLDMASDGTMYVLTAAPREVETNSASIMIIDDVIQKIAPDGTTLQQVSLFEILAENQTTRPLLGEAIRQARHWFSNMDQWQAARIQEKPEARSAYEAMFELYDEAFVKKTRELSVSDQLYTLLPTPADILHSNTVDVLSGRPDGLWQEGHVLVSVRNLDLIFVVDLDARQIVWLWGPGELSRQHQPSVLANGNLLIFDNRTTKGQSRIVELAPETNEIVWTYGETPETRFFSSAMGGVQGLPNGNVLITESSAGRAFEVNREGEVVWDFFNPEQGYNPFAGGDDEVIGSIYRVVRVER